MPRRRRFAWEIFLLAGAPSARRARRGAAGRALRRRWRPSVTYFGGATDVDELSAFANPDNLGFDADGNLWIVTDGNQPGDNNDGCFVCPTDGPERGQVRQFMSGPIGAEVCGCEFTRGRPHVVPDVAASGRSRVGDESAEPLAGRRRSCAAAERRRDRARGARPQIRHAERLLVLARQHVAHDGRARAADVLHERDAGVRALGSRRRAP